MKKSAVRHAISFSNLMVELLKGQKSGQVFAVKKRRRSKHGYALQNKKPKLEKHWAFSVKMTVSAPSALFFYDLGALPPLLMHSSMDLNSVNFLVFS